MKICAYDEGTPGLIEGATIYPLGEALAAAGATRAGATMAEVVDALANNPAPGAALAAARRAKPVALASARLLAPIDNPPAIWAAAANYRDHQAEMKELTGSNYSQISGDDLMAEVFLKPTSSLIGPGGTVILPKIARHVDFECELCAVIGRTAKNVPAEKALDHVYGYTMCWDISIRDPWGKGRHNTRNIRKGFDTFCGLGPWIVTRDEIREPQDLRINVEQNGKNVMQAHTADMINGLRDLIRFLSSVTTLKPGTLITTGTPAGVSKLAPGDHLKGTIDGIGTMELKVGAEQ